jgi:hypothetical protein
VNPGGQTQPVPPTKSSVLPIVLFMGVGAAALYFLTKKV